MEPLSEPIWDVIISGTGLQQSLLALALSRSGKKILHVDKNDYYGGAEAAFTLKEAEDWADRVNNEPGMRPFEHASVVRECEDVNRLPSRSYALSLAPQILYSRAELLSALLSSKVFRQIEFLAVGSWWMYDSDSSQPGASLKRIPNGREDIFADEHLPPKAKRTMIRFLRNMLNPQEEDVPAQADQSLTLYLQSAFNIPAELCEPLASLALSPRSADQTPSIYALPRIKRHLSSIGVFGPGFGSVLPRWGGASEIAQVSCRACAVGGGVYVLGRGIESIEPAVPGDVCRHVVLMDGERVKGRTIVGSAWDLPETSQEPCAKSSRSITIVSSPLDVLFPRIPDGGPLPAGAVVFIPDDAGGSPVCLIIHSSDSGECPAGQSVIYASAAPGDNSQAHTRIDDAIRRVLADADPAAHPLWTLHYTQVGDEVSASDPARMPANTDSRSPSEVGSPPTPTRIPFASPSPHVYTFPAPSLDLAYDDNVLGRVRLVWERIMGEDAGAFLKFEDREEVEEYE